MSMGRFGLRGGGCEVRMDGSFECLLLSGVQ